MSTILERLEEKNHVKFTGSEKELVENIVVRLKLYAIPLSLSNIVTRLYEFLKFGDCHSMEEQKTVMKTLRKMRSGSETQG